MLVLNSFALTNASYGVRRYASDLVSLIDKSLQWRKLRETGKPQLDRSLGLLCNVDKHELLWTPTPTGSLRALNQIVTVHDCIALTYGLQSAAYHSLYMQLSQRIFSRCACIVFISHEGLRQFEQFFFLPDIPKRVIASGFPVHPVLSKLCDHDVELAQNSSAHGKPYLLTIGNALPHKNIGALCEAFNSSRLPTEGFELRIVGKLDARAEKARAIAPNHIRALPFLSDNELRVQLKGATAYVSPSMLDGHNLTIAEALQQGTPVFASDIPAHREFYDGMCRFFDVTTQDAIIEALNSLLLSAPQHPGWDTVASARSLTDTAAEYCALFRQLSDC
jgi:glycosyltransferase involved in cell wall biosynthesis